MFKKRPCISTECSATGHQPGMVYLRSTPETVLAMLLGRALASGNPQMALQSPKRFFVGGGHKGHEKPRFVWSPKVWSWLFAEPDVQRAI